MTENTEDKPRQTPNEKVEAIKKSQASKKSLIRRAWQIFNEGYQGSQADAIREYNMKRYKTINKEQQQIPDRHIGTYIGAILKDSRKLVAESPLRVFEPATGVERRLVIPDDLVGNHKDGLIGLVVYTSKGETSNSKEAPVPVSAGVFLTTGENGAKKVVVVPAKDHLTTKRIFDEFRDGVAAFQRYNRDKNHKPSGTKPVLPFTRQASFQSIGGAEIFATPKEEIKSEAIKDYFKLHDGDKVADKGLNFARAALGQQMMPSQL